MSKPGKPVSIEVPGSKSLSNRALILSVLCNTQTTLKNVALCDDTNHMIKALKQLGIKIHQDGTTVKIQGILQNGKLNFPKKKNQIRIFTGNAGTTTRFLTALAPLTGNEIIIDGDARMRERPIKELVKALNALGAKIESINGYPPLKIRSSALNGGKISLPGNISSQYLSAILMVAPFAIKKTTVNIEQKLYSKPYIKMTIKLMGEFGFKVVNKNFRQFIIEPVHQTNQVATKITEKFSSQISQRGNEQNRPTGKKTEKIQKIFAKTYTIESDASSASYIGAYAALHPEKKILLKNIHKNSLQGDIKFLEYLKKMGCKTIEQKNGTIVRGPRKLKSLGTIDMNKTPDLVMTFAVLALFTKGKNRITNIGNLRIKETDRLQALENEIKNLANALNLKKLIVAKIGKDWIEIYRLKSVPGDKSKNKDKNSQLNQIYRSKNPAGDESTNNKTESQILVHTYNDHRIAMSFGILTDIFPFLKIENPSCVSKSYTTFWKDLKKCHKPYSKKTASKNYTKIKKITKQNSTQNHSSKNIILTGLRGSGKSKIGKIMAEKITKLTKRNWNFIDIDAEIENRENTTIRNIVEIHGWEYFRDVESQVAKKVSKLKNTVIATGGGTIIDKENEKIFKKTGKIVYLHVKPEICAKRILNSSSRPPLTNKKSVKEEIKHLYKERNGRYRKNAHLIFKRSEDPEKDADEIVKKLNIKKNKFKLQ